MIGRIFGGIWRGLDGLRKFLHLLLLHRHAGTGGRWRTAFSLPLQLPDLQLQFSRLLHEPFMIGVEGQPLRQPSDASGRFPLLSGEPQ